MIKNNYSLKQFNTFGLDVMSRYFAEINSVEEARDLMNLPEAKENELLILGGGSNILFTRDFSGLIILNRICGISVIEEDKDAISLKVGAGENWNDLVSYCVNNNWGGIENLSLIPGCVGAAPMQNIGAYGSEIKDVLLNVSCIEIKTGKIKNFTAEECELGYRQSIFKSKIKGEYLISHISIVLAKNPIANVKYGAIEETLKESNILDPTIKDVSKAVIRIRKSKLPDPKVLGNAGSFFKNPVISQSELEKLKVQFKDIKFYMLDNGSVKIPAGWLIEKAGWKGKIIGETGNHAQQALVVVNYGKATGEEIVSHALNVQKSIEVMFGIKLEMEVNVI